MLFFFHSFLSIQLHHYAFVVVHFISILKRIISVIGQHFVLSGSILPKNITATRCRPIVCTNLFRSNISLPVVENKYSFTSVRNTLASLITSIESLEPPSCWYNLSDNGKVSLCELLRLKMCIFIYIENMWSNLSK